ncbi:hypothetical protein FRC04_006580 [Tulasnella sp. 424]|nr:hypothetical protein FRC04_006580 [Tulasnella sp. 424]
MAKGERRYWARSIGARMVFGGYQLDRTHLGRPSLADFAIIHIPPASPVTRDEHLIEGSGHEHVVGEDSEEEDDGPWSESGVEVGRDPQSSTAVPQTRPPVQKIKPAFILAPRPFIPGIIPKPAGSARYSRSWNGKGTKERENRRMTARRMDSRGSRLTWPTRALSSLHRKRITENMGDAQSLALGFDSAILLNGLGEDVDEFGRNIDNLGKLPEDIPLPPSPGESPTEPPSPPSPPPPPRQLVLLIRHLVSRILLLLSPRTLPQQRHLPLLTRLEQAPQIPPYYTRPLPNASKRNQLHWEFDPLASTYLFIHTVIVFSEPVLPDLNFLDGAKVPGVADWRNGRSEEPMGRAL